MTAIVGILCKDGAVIGTDSSTTFTASSHHPTIEQQCEKLDVIEERIIVAGTGPVGLGQRFCNILKKAWDDKLFQNQPIDVGKTLAQSGIEDFRQTYLNPGKYGSLIAFPCQRKPHLCEFVVQDFQPEMKTDRIWYCSMGSTQPITDPFLAFIREVFWQKGQPALSDGIFAVTWVLEHAIAVNPGGVNAPARLAVLEKTEKDEWKARLLPDEELDEHRQYIAEAKKCLREFRLKLAPKGQQAVPEIPKP